MIMNDGRSENFQPTSSKQMPNVFASEINSAVEFLLATLKS